MKKLVIIALPIILFTTLASFSKYTSNNKIDTDCGCFRVDKMKGRETVKTWNERYCDESGYGYPKARLKDQYTKIYDGTGYSVIVSDVADYWCK
jgi:hypothetical protein